VGAEGWSSLAAFEVPSRPGSDRSAAERVGECLQGTPLTGERLERLKTGVAEAVLNAVEHGHQNRPELPVRILVEVNASSARVSVSDQGGGFTPPAGEAPDLAAKLAGKQTSRGWGLLLMGEMADEVRTRLEAGRYTVELVMRFREVVDGI